jgi:hypothetical protein
MTTINYKINNQTSKDLTASNWASAQELQKQTIEQELKLFDYWNITAVITNNDGTITMCPVNENGTPTTIDGPYVDTTVAPSV